MKKRVIAVVLCILFAMSCSAFTFAVSAVNVGEAVGETLYTDIKAFINGSYINSYNIDGNTAVVAEELASYGYDVVWDSSLRTLTVTPVAAAVEYVPTPQMSIDRNMIGVKAFDVLYTDIRTFIGDREVKGFNVGGKTIIFFDELASGGKVEWLPDGRKITLEKNNFFGDTTPILNICGRDITYGDFFGYVNSVYDLNDVEYKQAVESTIESMRYFYETIDAAKELCGYDAEIDVELFDEAAKNDNFAHLDKFARNLVVSYAAAYEKLCRSLVTDAELCTYAKQNYVRVKEIVVSLYDRNGDGVADENELSEMRAKIKEIYDGIQGGKSFDTAGAEYNDSPIMPYANDGFVFAEDDYISQLFDIAMGLDDNSISGIIELFGSCYILQRLPLTDELVLSDEIVCNDIACRIAEIDGRITELIDRRLSEKSGSVICYYPDRMNGLELNY